jgi:hypothetical protein
MKTDDDWIAEFDGLELIIPKNQKYSSYYRRYDNGAVVAEYHRNPSGSFDGRLKYNTSWNWLMPVVEKIEAICGASITIQQKWCCVKHHITATQTTIVSDLKITATYKAVVAFIKWRYLLNSSSTKQEG